MRAQLLCLLAGEPNVMLLDEPTNYLDLESLVFLEHFLVDFPGAFLLISHDRRFLKRVADHILEVEAPDLTKFPGDIDDYFEQKRVLREQLEREALKQEAKRKHMMDFVNRFRAKASKARQAQSRLKLLDKMPPIEIRDLPVQARIKLPAPGPSPKLILKMQDVALGYGTRPVLSGIDLNIERGDRIGVVGPNGAGKSTLLKALSGSLPPLRGAVEWGRDVRLGYFAQHLTESLNLNATVESELQKQAHPDVTPQELRNLAGSLLFREEQDLKKRVGVLSGGEKSRVALGQILLQKCPILVLDEPTNHLDFDTVESLSQALAEYSGTLIAVSHDRDFISRVATKILQIQNGQVLVYPGSYEDYAWSVERGSYGATSAPRALAPTSENSPSDLVPVAHRLAPESTKQRRIEANRELRAAQEQIKKLERDMLRLEDRIKEGTRKIESLGLSAPELAAAGEDLAQAQSALGEMEEQWLECQERIATLEALLKL